MKKAFYVFGLVAFLVSCYFVVKSINWSSEQPLPQKFLGYQSIDSLTIIERNSLRMDLLMESVKNLEYFTAPDHKLIIYGMPKNMENLFYKMDTAGNIVDSLKVRSKAEDILLLKGLIVDKQANEYFQWTFNGSKSRIKIVTENADLKWDLERQEKKVEEILSSKAFFIDHKYDEPKPQKVTGNKLQPVQGITGCLIVTYVKDNQAYRFYTRIKVDNRISWSATQAMLWNNVFKELNQKNNYDGEIIESPNIAYQYFQKLKQEKVRFSGGGGNAPGYTKMLFPGYLFTDVAVKNDTLKLKEFMFLEEDGHTATVKVKGKAIGSLIKTKSQPVEDFDGYMYYTTSRLNYALFTNNDKKVYLITRR